MPALTDETWDGTCPACGTPLSDLWERVDPEEEEVQIRCEHCEVALKAIAHVRIDYQIRVDRKG